MLTKSDIKQIQKLFNNSFSRAFQDSFGEAFENVYNKFKGEVVTFKDEILTRLDAVMGELQTIRSEQTMMSGRVSENTDQIENHEMRIGKIETALDLPES